MKNFEGLGLASQMFRSPVFEEMERIEKLFRSPVFKAVEQIARQHKEMFRAVDRMVDAWRPALDFAAQSQSLVKSAEQALRASSWPALQVLERSEVLFDRLTSSPALEALATRMAQLQAVIEQAVAPTRQTVRFWSLENGFLLDALRPTLNFTFDVDLWNRERSAGDELVFLVSGDAEPHDWQRVATMFGLQHEDLGAFFLVVAKGNWCDVEDVRRYVFGAVRYLQGHDLRPLLGPRAGRAPLKVELRELVDEERSSPSDIAHARRQLEKLLAEAGERDGRVVSLRAQKHRWREIQKTLGLSDRELAAAKKRFGRLVKRFLELN